MTASAQYVSVSVVLPDRNTILLVRLAGDHGGWNLPSATVTAGETIEQAARRAVLEATGVAVALTNLVGIYSAVLAAAPTSVSFVFSAYTTPGRVRPGAHVAALEWLLLDEIDGLPNDQLADAPLLRRIVADVRQGMRFPLGVLIEPGDV